MGAGRRGLYSGTYGSMAAAIKQPSVTISLPGRPILKANLNHANSGDFQKNGRMTGGGHGQDNLAELKARGQKFTIKTPYKNGVREGNIPNHTKRAEREGKHMWFPKDWTKDTINQAGQYVVKLKKNQHIANGEVTGTYRGVAVGVRLRNGRIETIYPLFDQPNN